MNTLYSMHKRHRFPPEIIQHAVWLYHRFNLSTRDFEDLLAERGIAVSYETMRTWCRKFGPKKERAMRRFGTLDMAQRFLTVHATTQNLFNLGRHHVAARHYRDLRHTAFASWKRAAAA